MNNPDVPPPAVSCLRPTTVAELARQMCSRVSFAFEHSGQLTLVLNWVMKRVQTRYVRNGDQVSVQEFPYHTFVPDGSGENAVEVRVLSDLSADLAQEYFPGVPGISEQLNAQVRGTLQWTNRSSEAPLRVVQPARLTHSKIQVSQEQTNVFDPNLQLALKQRREYLMSYLDTNDIKNQNLLASSIWEQQERIEHLVKRETSRPVGSLEMSLEDRDYDVEREGTFDRLGMVLDELTPQVRHILTEYGLSWEEELFRVSIPPGTLRTEFNTLEKTALLDRLLLMYFYVIESIANGKLEPTESDGGLAEDSVLTIPQLLAHVRAQAQQLRVSQGPTTQNSEQGMLGLMSRFDDIYAHLVVPALQALTHAPKDTFGWYLRHEWQRLSNFIQQNRLRLLQGGSGTLLNTLSGGAFWHRSNAEACTNMQFLASGQQQLILPCADIVKAWDAVISTIETARRTQ